MNVVKKMNFLAGSSKDSWKPVMTANTTFPSYWLNWRVLVCAIWIFLSLCLAFFLIWKYEFQNSRPGNRKDEGRGGGRRRRRGDDEKEDVGFLYEDETWMPCLKGIHPAWLLAFRVFAFFVLLVLLIICTFVDGGIIFYYYTMWTFTSITIYFGIGSLISINGCYKYHKKVSGEKVDNVEVDTEQQQHQSSTSMKISATHHESHFHEPAGLTGYVFQIIFQMTAGAVMLTDCLFWFIIVPFFAIKDYNLNFLIINMHSINAFFLLGETTLNCLRFPWFRIGYFFLWTTIYVIFQWLVHACVPLWWPYPFLDLSSPFSPLWYFSVALMHIPCYGIFALIMKLKHHVFSTWDPGSYQCVR